jgi:hypothetical protein
MIRQSQTVTEVTRLAIAVSRAEAGYQAHRSFKIRRTGKPTLRETFSGFLGISAEMSAIALITNSNAYNSNAPANPG